MRIITGSARGMKLKTLPGLDTRPTSERTKEAVFSMIQFEIDGRNVLDLYAGSGQMGLEALSRGAASAVFVDMSPEAMTIIKENAAHTRLEDRCKFRISDARNFLRKAAALERRTHDGGAPDRLFDLVFLDPPYDKGLVGDTLVKLADCDLLSPDAIVVCECSKTERPDDNPEVTARYEIRKANTYGRAFIYILLPKAGQDEKNAETVQK